jgi:hypothetical protein
MAADTGGLGWQKSFVVVSSYTNFKLLAHGPRGTEAQHSLRTFQLDHTTGALTLVAINNEPMNPAFSRFHPNLNNLYVCTETIKDQGEVFTYDVNARTGALEYRAKHPCGGSSTCYITIDRTLKHMLLVNYWDSTLTTLELNPEGTPIGVKSVLDPKEGKGVRACVRGCVRARAFASWWRFDSCLIRNRRPPPPRAICGAGFMCQRESRTAAATTTKTTATAPTHRTADNDCRRSRPTWRST